MKPNIFSLFSCVIFFKNLEFDIFPIANPFWQLKYVWLKYLVQISSLFCVLLEAPK